MIGSVCVNYDCVTDYLSQVSLTISYLHFCESIISSDSLGSSGYHSHLGQFSASPLDDGFYSAGLSCLLSLSRVLPHPGLSSSAVLRSMNRVSPTVEGGRGDPPLFPDSCCLCQVQLTEGHEHRELAGQESVCEFLAAVTVTTDQTACAILLLQQIPATVSLQRRKSY